MTRPISDLPARPGLLHRLHLLAGTMAINVSNALRPRLTLGVRIAAFDPEGRVFLVRHSYVPGFYLPGGGVELGETCREAVIREASEEGGLVFDTPPNLHHIYRCDTLGRRDHIVLFVAYGTLTPNGFPKTGGEILDAGFYAPDALPDDATRATRARVAELMSGEAPSDIW
ncbi:NUDIX domain-containing protein [Amaricoccus sp. B4]|uniref:NUDIX domain-containing protein n=1 Tax=Amaricoccus sp. B4 TaxID=3368557 RepID=UPI00370FB61A